MVGPYPHIKRELSLLTLVKLTTTPFFFNENLGRHATAGERERESRPTPVADGTFPGGGRERPGSPFGVPFAGGGGGGADDAGPSPRSCGSHSTSVSGRAETAAVSVVVVVAVALFVDFS